MRVGGKEVAGAEKEEGIYSFDYDGASYSVNVARGIVDTGEFAALDDVDC